MKLNKREEQAFSILEKILKEYRSETKEEEIIITTSDYNAINEVFGIDLKQCTFYKKDVEEFKRGKSNKHLSFLPPFDRNNFKKLGIFAYPYGYFPFQIKELKNNKPVKEEN